MDIRSTQRLLSQLRVRLSSCVSSRQRSLIRVARRWLVADMMTDYDLIMRLQILEGVAGVPSGSWGSGQPRQGLKEAIGHFQSRKDSVNLDPAWLSPRPSGMSHISLQIAGSAIKSWSKNRALTIEPFEVLNGMIMGLGSGVKEKKVKKDKEGEKPLYRIGVFPTYQDKILSGSADPAFVAKTAVGKFIKNRVTNYAGGTRRERFSLPVDEEGNTLDIKERPKNEETTPDELLIGIIFRDRTDPLGKKIRNFMRRSWMGTTQQEAMDFWLDKFEESGKFPKKLEIAAEIGYTAQSFSRAWKVSWTQFFKDLWSNSGIINLLQERFSEEGVAWIPKPPADFDEVLLKAKKASLFRRGSFS